MSTYTPIASQTITSATTGITFESIPQNYTDLVLVVNGNTTAGPTDNNMRFNNDAGNNYSVIILYGDSSGAGSVNSWAANMEVGGIYWGSGRGSRVVQINEYANPNVYKSVLSRASSDTQVNTRWGVWRNTAPITSIYVFVGASTYVAGTTFNLYGIQSGGGYAQGGDIVTTDGTYWYHAFTTSGTFTPTRDLTADVLVIAGGGGGGHAGGGAGGLRGITSQSLTKDSNYFCTIGAGGVGTTDLSFAITGASGNNSSFFGTGITTINATAGGGGGGIGLNGLSGGSGGGGGGNNQNPNTTGGAGNAGGYSPVEGFAGGASTGINNNQTSAGGGGATQAGQNSQSASVSGAGGAGSSAYSSWGSATLTGQNVSGTYWFAGGGGGGHGVSGTVGAGGNGGGGAGVNGSSAPNAGSFATGGGGGGGNFTNKTGGTGGSGIVIVRYAV